MKLIKTNDEIVVLENVKAVVKNRYGTGTKSCPFIFSITIFYFNGKDYTIKFDQDVQSFNECYEDIFNILSQKDK